MWSSEETNLLQELLATGCNYGQISNSINSNVTNKVAGFNYSRSLEAVSRKAERLNLGTKKPADDNSAATIVTTDKYTKVDNTWDTIKALQKQYKEDSKFHSVGINLVGPFIKILCLSDIHFPFARMDMLEAILNKHSDADILVLNGDILDSYALSSFSKDKSVALIDEYQTTFEFVNICRRLFKRVVLTMGNHEIRNSKLLNTLSKEVTSYYQPDILRRLANGERLDRDGVLVEKLDFSNVFYPKTEQWWVQIGKTLFIHPHSRGSSKPGHTVITWADKFKQRLGQDAFDSIVAAHTHKQYKGVVNSTLLIEQGCLADYMSYTWSPKDIYHDSAANGYAVIYQDSKGNTDFNESNFYYMGTLLPENKPIYNYKDNQLTGDINEFFKTTK